MNYYGATDLAESFRTVRKNIIQVAEDIPEDKYSFRAAPDTMSVGEILAHFATTPHWAQQCHFVEKKAAVAMEDFGRWMGEAGGKSQALSTKTLIVDLLKSNGEEFAKKVEHMTDAQLGERVGLPMGDKTRFEMLLGVPFNLPRSSAPA
ncbi:MAG: hypothetical protein H0T71_00250 [Acidobacteria bacterium]|nr:hypothetical protein [Acidobacteriota bacterium]